MRRGMNWQSTVGFVMLSLPTLVAGQPATDNEPVLSKAARAVGVRQCLTLVSATAKRVTQGATGQDILLDWDHRTPDAGPLFSLTGINIGPQAAAASVVAVPSPTGGCTLLVERISATAKPCPAVAKAELAGYRATPLLPNIMVYSRPDRGLESTTLITSSGACLILRRQAVFNWLPPH